MAHKHEEKKNGSGNECSSMESVESQKPDQKGEGDKEEDCAYNCVNSFLNFNEIKKGILRESWKSYRIYNDTYPKACFPRNS